MQLRMRSRGCGFARGYQRAFVGPLTHSRKLQSHHRRAGTDTTGPAPGIAPGTAPSAGTGIGADTGSVTSTEAAEAATPPLTFVPNSFTAQRPATASAALSPICPTTTTKGLPLLPYKQLSAAPRISLSSTLRLQSFSTHPPAAPASASTSAPLPIMAYEGKWTAQEVRKTFLSYFEERGHTIGMILDGHNAFKQQI